MGKLYLAYGSNLNLQQMKYRCPNSKVYGRATLNGYRLAFHGNTYNAHATILRKKGYKIPVLIWDVPEEDEKALDRYEGYPRYYFKEDIVATMESGEIVTAMVYIMDRAQKSGIPSERYVETITEGYNDCNFDLDYLRLAIKENQDETKKLRARYRICPKCGIAYAEHPALSRKDNSEICPTCGMREALEAYLDYIDEEVNA